MMRRADGKGPLWEEMLGPMERDTAHDAAVLTLPDDQVVEIGRPIAI